MFVNGHYWGGVENVIVFKDNIHGGHGRLVKDSAPNQWEKGGTLEFRYQKSFEKYCEKYR